jgi:transketolase
MSMEELSFEELSMDDPGMCVDEPELVAEIKRSIVTGRSSTTQYEPTNKLLEMTYMRGVEAFKRQSQYVLLYAVAMVQLELNSQDQLQLHTVETSVVSMLSASALTRT